MKIRALTAASLAAVMVVAGCASQPGAPRVTDNQVATGTIVGGALGAAAGQAIGGDTRSTAAGALAGMSAGMATGAVLEGQRQANQPRTCTVYRGGVAVGTTQC